MKQEGMTHAEWLEKRRKYIGGSDAAAAIGLSRFKSQHQLYLDKIEGVAQEPTEAMERGNVLEPIVKELYERRVGYQIQPGAWLVSKTHDWMAATPDAVDGRINSLVQIKTASSWTRHLWGDDGSNEVPDDYMIQAQHEMAVTGAARNMFAVLFAPTDTFRALVWMVKADMTTQMICSYIEEQISADDSQVEFKCYPIQRNDDLIETIVAGEKSFWFEYVKAQVAPPSKEVPEKSPEFIEADGRQRDMVKMLREAYETLKAAESDYEQRKVVLQTEIGDMAGIVADGIGKIHYKAPRPKPKTDTKAVLSAFARLHPDDYEAAKEENTEVKQGVRVFRPYWQK